MKAACGLCPHNCVLAPGAQGNCGARENRSGRIVSLTYGRIASLAVDPVEKKPLYHFYPGAAVFSAGTWGCNLHCAFCQNWEISQISVPTREISAAELIAAAQAEKVSLIAYTYNEPYVNFEYVRDCCRAARAAGLRNVLVTNGYYNPEPAAELLPLADAANIDLKAFTDDFYQRHCGGKLVPVLAAIKQASRCCHLELTTLLIPGENDRDAEIDAEARWIADNCGPDTPLHLSGYFPRYKFTVPATPAAVLFRAREIAKRYLRFVYIGNSPVAGTESDNGVNTVCYRCGALLIVRRGYQTDICGLREDGKCAECGQDCGIVTGRPQ